MFGGKEPSSPFGTFSHLPRGKREKAIFTEFGASRISLLPLALANGSTVPEGRMRAIERSCACPLNPQYRAQCLTQIESCRSRHLLCAERNMMVRPYEQTARI